mmetsp:Transcript_3090/g.9569  ORF Transcript_3090/g.9569 Transcript_3090/m.9569 type:complete len:235 (+) Transcript_3090:137-841(+)
MPVAASAHAVRQQRRSPLLGIAILAFGGLQVLQAVLSGWAFTGITRDLGRSGKLPAPLPTPERRSSLVLAAAGGAERLGGEKEMSDLDKFLDRWNTRGGAILATFIGLIVVWVFEKGLEIVGVDSATAGVWTSGVFFFGLLVWTGQYFTRVMTKSTTYAQQLENYEREVMIKRLQELDEEEIAALCEEVGVSPEEISDAVGGKVEALSQKEQVIKLFKNTTMPKDVDPRALMGS